jgi:AsmA protein
MTWRWVWGILLAVIIGVSGLAVGVLSWIDPNDFKPQILSTVRALTGRELTIHGELELELFPHLAVSVHSLELGNGLGFDGPFLTLREAHLQARFLPLLQSRLEVVALNVEGLSLFLSRDHEGRGNWLDLATPQPSEGTPENGSVLKRDKRVPILASLIVDGLKVADARVVWDDRFKNRHYDVRGINLDVSDFTFGEPFDVDTNAAMTIGPFGANLKFRTRAILDFDRLVLEDLSLAARIGGDGLPRSSETIALTIQYASTDGHIDNGRMQGLGLDVRFAMRAATSEAPAAGSWNVATFSPKEVATRLGLILPVFMDSTALARTALSCDWSSDGDTVDVSNLSLIMDNSTMQGSMHVSGLEKPFVSLEMNVDVLDLNRYRIRPTVGHGKGGEKEASEAIVLPLRELRYLNTNATINVGILAVAKVRCTDALIRGHAKGGLLVLDTIGASMYGGRLQASATLDVRSDTPVYSWSHAVSKLQIGPLLADLHGQAFVSGTSQSVAKLDSRGETITALKHNLSGVFDFQVTDGALHGVNIEQRIRDGIRNLKGQPPGPSGPERTFFSLLSGSGVIAGGMETSQNLLLLAPRFRINGGGQADLLRENMDFRLVLTLEGSEGKLDEGVLGLTSIPVRVSGPIREPTVAPDMDAVLRGLGLSGGKVVGDALKGVGSGLNKGVKGIKRLFQ